MINQMYKIDVLRHKIKHSNYFKGMLETLKENIPSSDWHTMKVGDVMSKDIKRCIDLVLYEDICKELFYFTEENIPKLWIVLEEDNYETNMKITKIIEDSLSYNSVEADYMFFDESEIEEITEQLQMNNIDARRMSSHG